MVGRIGEESTDGLLKELRANCRWQKTMLYIELWLLISINWSRLAYSGIVLNDNRAFSVRMINHRGLWSYWCRGMQVLDDRIVPWFPRNEGELDVIANKVLEAGVDIESDHPGFSDLGTPHSVSLSWAMQNWTNTFIQYYFLMNSLTDYRDRRGVLASVAKGYRHLDPLPLVEYTEEENNTWRQVYNRLQASQEKYACAEYLSILPLMRDHCGYCPDKIPQVREGRGEIRWVELNLVSRRLDLIRAKEGDKKEREEIKRASCAAV